MSIPFDLRNSCWIVLWFGLAVQTRAAEPEIRQLRGPKGGPAIACAVYAPQLAANGRAGLVVHLYGSGGAHRRQAYNVGRSSYDELRRLLAKRGYWLVVPELGPRHWMNGAACARVDSVITTMVEHEGIDPRRVHLLGTSMGGGSGLIYVMRRPGRIKSVVAIFPMTDFAQWINDTPRYREVVERAHGITPEQREQSLHELSPIHHPDAFRNTPVFLLHGGRDSIVNPNHSRSFAKVLRERGYSVTYREEKGETHRDEIARSYQRELADFLTGSSPSPKPID